MRRTQKPAVALNKLPGFSLVELMVALTLGLLVVGAMIQLFAGNRATFNANEALARVQENGRFATEVLRREVRSVNFYGTCAAILPITNHLRTDCGTNNVISIIFGGDRAVIGWEFLGSGPGETYDALVAEADLDPDGVNQNSWRARSGADNLDLPAFLQNRVVPGSDVLVLRIPEPVPGVTADPPHGSAANIDLSGPSGIRSNELALVTNCTTGVDLFHNTATGNTDQLTAAVGSCTSPGPGNRGLAWSTSYGNTMQVFRIRKQAFYIGYNDTSGEPGLWRVDLSRGIENAVYEELVGGVETMQILYGYSLPADQGGDGQTVNFWLTADAVPDWDFVIAVRIGLVARSSEGMSAGSLRRTFNLAGTTFTHPDDVRLRHQFSVTISLRNQQLVL